MSMLKSKIAKVVVIFMAVAMTIVPLNAFAESQIKRPTYQNKTVYCSLDCTFYIGKDDVATATTEWAGKKGYTVKTVLWQCQDSDEKYKKLGSAISPKTAVVANGIKGVWKFMSKHYGRVGNNDDKNTRLAVIKDW